MAGEKIAPRGGGDYSPSTFALASLYTDFARDVLGDERLALSTLWCRENILREFTHSPKEYRTQAIFLETFMGCYRDFRLLVDKLLPRLENQKRLNLDLVSQALTILHSHSCQLLNPQDYRQAQLKLDYLVYQYVSETDERPETVRVIRLREKSVTPQDKLPLLSLKIYTSGHIAHAIVTKNKKFPVINENDPSPVFKSGEDWIFTAKRDNVKFWDVVFPLVYIYQNPKTQGKDYYAVVPSEYQKSIGDVTTVSLQKLASLGIVAQPDYSRQKRTQPFPIVDGTVWLSGSVEPIVEKEPTFQVSPPYNVLTKWIETDVVIKTPRSSAVISGLGRDKEEGREGVSYTVDDTGTGAFPRHDEPSLLLSDDASRQSDNDEKTIVSLADDNRLRRMFKVLYDFGLYS